MTSSQTLSVEYVGQFPFIVEQEATDEISVRSAVEGGTGIYENLEVDEDIRGATLAVSRAAGLLRRFGEIATTARVETFDGTAAIGETVTIDLSAHGVSVTDFLVATRSVREIGDAAETFQYVYSTSSPPEEFESWREFYEKLFLAGKRTSVGRSSELLLISRSSTEEVTVNDNVSTSSSASSIKDHDLYDAYTAMRIGKIDGKYSALVGVCMIGSHNED
jgi:hypothetical protein